MNVNHNVGEDSLDRRGKEQARVIDASTDHEFD